MHIPRRIQFTHTGVHQRKTRLTSFPQFKLRLIVSPFQKIIPPVKITPDSIRKEIHNLHKKLPPYQLIHELHVPYHTPNHASHTHRPETQMRRQIACTIQIGNLPHSAVLFQPIQNVTVKDEHRQHRKATPKRLPEPHVVFQTNVPSEPEQYNLLLLHIINNNSGNYTERMLQINYRIRSINFTKLKNNHIFTPQILKNN